MLQLKPFTRRIMVGRCCALAGSHPVRFHCAQEFDALALAHMLDSLVRVSRRGKENHFVRALQKGCLGPDRDLTTRASVPKNLPHPEAYPADVEPALTRRETHDNRSKPKAKTTHDNTGCLRFPLSNFKYFLTLFSKFFASFPHGTCSLSVSHPYLALEGIYLPL